MTNERDDLNRLCGHVVRVAGAFAVAVAAVLALVTLRSWVVNPAGAGGWTLPVLESAQMRELKARLAASPKDEAVKKDIRRLDLMLRAEHFRREAMVVRGGWLLLAALAVAAAAAHVIATLRKRPHLPAKKTCVDGVELPTAARGRWAVGVLTIALGAGGGLLAITSAGQLPRQFAQAFKNGEGSPGPETQPANGQKVVAAASGDYPAPQEIARNWPRFRGPGGAGVSAFANVPAEWDIKTGKNIAWRTPIPLPGTSSPVIWGNRVFVTGAGRDKSKKSPDDEDQPDSQTQPASQPASQPAAAPTAPAGPGSHPADDVALPTTSQPAAGEKDTIPANLYFRNVYGLDLATGKLLWTTSIDVPGARLPKSVFPDTGYAAPTPVTDGRRVYVIFASGELAALDFEGKVVWQQDRGVPVNDYGQAASLEMHKGRLFVQYDQGHQDEKLGYLLILDAATGKLVRKVPRPDVMQSWTSPIVAETPAGDQLITVANELVIAYNPADGSEIWRAGKVDGDGAPSPIYTQGLVIAGNVSSPFMAIKPDGRGDVSKTHVLWRIDDNLPDISSPLSDGQRLYLVAPDALVRCWSLKDGTGLWQQDLPDQAATPSPSLAGDRIYLPTKKGAVFILQAGDKAKLLGRMELGDQTEACPAFVDGKIVFRTKKHLVCVENKAGPVAAGGGK